MPGHVTGDIHVSVIECVLSLGITLLYGLGVGI